MNNVLLICQYLSHCSACPWFSGGCQNSVLIASPKPVGACQHLLILGYDVIALLSLPLSLRYTCTSFDTFRRYLKTRYFQSGLPIHLTPVLLRVRFGFYWPLCASINYIYLLTHLLPNSTLINVLSMGSVYQKYLLSYLCCWSCAVGSTDGVTYALYALYAFISLLAVIFIFLVIFVIFLIVRKWRSQQQQQDETEITGQTLLWERLMFAAVNALPCTKLLFFFVSNV